MTGMRNDDVRCVILGRTDCHRVSEVWMWGIAKPVINSGGESRMTQEVSSVALVKPKDLSAESAYFPAFEGIRMTVMTEMTINFNFRETCYTSNIL